MESAGSAQIKNSELPVLVLSVAVQGLDDIFVCVFKLTPFKFLYG